MKFFPALVEGRLEKRWKRFLAEVVLKSGERVIAHCPNPGSMRGNASMGVQVFLYDNGADHLRQGKKLRYRWVLVFAHGAYVCIDTSIGNKLIREALKNEQILELSAYEEIYPECALGETRLDFLLQSPKKTPCFVEVKSVSLVEDGIAFFPDSVTKRGQKHLWKLAELKLHGYRSVLLFLVQRSGLQRMRPADHIDSIYGELLRMAVSHGVEVLVYDMVVDLEQGLHLGKRLSIEL